MFLKGVVYITAALVTGSEKLQTQKFLNELVESIFLVAKAWFYSLLNSYNLVTQFGLTIRA